MSDKREVVEERIVKSLLGDLDERPPTPWYKIWFYYKPKWRWFEFSTWFSGWYQRLTTGFAHKEAWDFTHWHSEMVVPRLKWMRDNCTGYPCMDFDDDSDELPVLNTQAVCPGSGEESEQHFEQQRKRWIDILDKIIWSFENIGNEPMPIKPEDYDNRQLMKRYSDGSVSYESLDDRSWDWSPIHKHNKRVQEGLRLFAKYYTCLWD